MAIDRGFIDEVCARTDIVDMVSQYVALKKSGGRYVGLCPFHNEKTPSFSVSADKQAYHCFGCGAGGGVLSFVMQAEGLEFRDAVKMLADRAGMEMPAENQAEREAARKRERLLALNREAARFFYHTLWLPENQPVQQYFARRGLLRRTMNNFGLGFAPNSFRALIDAMRKKGYTPEELADAGLASRGDKGNLYDRFRGRVMFPIIDIRGNVVAFGGRVMDDSKPKYLNSPETQIFHKSRHLFALNLAKKSKSPYYLLAEGYMDVIALHQAGFDSAVASLGTSLTEEQARLLAQRTDQVIIVYDADEAGQRAAQRAIAILKQCDLRVKVLRIPGAKDPDEFIRSKGAEAFQVLLEQSEDHNAYQLEGIAQHYDLETDEGRVQFVRAASEMLATIANSVEREVYSARAARMAGVTAEAIKVEVAQAMRRRDKKQHAALRREIRSPVSMAQPRDRALAYHDIKSAKAEENVLRLLFSDQTLVAAAQSKLCADWFSSPVLRKLYERVLALDHAGRMVTISAFEGELSESEMRLLSQILEQTVVSGDHRHDLQASIDIIHMQRVRDGTLQQTQEDPLLTYGRMKKQNTGG